jgi:hypothetical protein
MAMTCARFGALAAVNIHVVVFWGIVSTKLAEAVKKSSSKEGAGIAQSA